MYMYVGCAAKSSDLKINEDKRQFSVFLHHSKKSSSYCKLCIHEYRIKHVMHMYQSLYRSLARFCHKLCDTVNKVQISNKKCTGMF